MQIFAAQTVCRQVAYVALTVDNKVWRCNNGGCIIAAKAFSEVVCWKNLVKLKSCEWLWRLLVDSGYLVDVEVSHSWQD